MFDGSVLKLLETSVLASMEPRLFSGIGLDFGGTGHSASVAASFLRAFRAEGSWLKPEKRPK